MHSGSLARRYALALLEVASEQQAPETVRAELKLLSKLQAQTPELEKILSAPSVRLTQKQQFLETVFGKRLSEITMRFLGILLAKRRIAILPDIIAAFEALWRERQHEVLVTVTTAIEPEFQLKEKITKYLHQSTDKEPVITWIVDASLLGGMQVRWPDRIEDGSLRRKLLEMRQALAEG